MCKTMTNAKCKLQIVRLTTTSCINCCARIVFDLCVCVFSVSVLVSGSNVARKFF